MTCIIYFALAGRSDWDDGRWEWNETPRRDSVSSSRRHQPSPSPMFLGASPDARLVSPWLGGNTPHSSCMLFFKILMFLIPITKFYDGSL